MAVALTNLPLPWQAEPALIDYGGDQTGSGGGSQSRFVRLGSRWSCRFGALPDLAWASAKPLLAARLAAMTAGSVVSCPWPQLPFSAPIGAPVVDGAGQAGQTLNVRGFTPALAAIVAGLWFSVTVSGRGYLYQVTDTVTVGGTGRATLAIAPWLRAAPTDGAALNFASPSIEGFLDTLGVTWDLTMRAWVTIPAFTITEIA